MECPIRQYRKKNHLRAYQGGTKTMIRTNNSPYTAITGCTFLYYEFSRMLPLLMEANAEALLRDEVENNRVLQVNSLASRKRFVAEFKRRYAAVPRPFWQAWQQLSEAGQRAGLFYAILKTYKLVFDLHVNVAMRKWRSVDHTLQRDDLMMELNELSAHDAYVDSWSDLTKSKCCSSYLTMLRQSGLLDAKSHALTPIHLDANEWAYYVRKGEEWFLEACLLYPYEMNDIKSLL